VVDKLLTHTEKQDNEITQLKALNKDLTDVLARLNIRVEKTNKELEAHKEVVNAYDDFLHEITQFGYSEGVGDMTATYSIGVEGFDEELERLRGLSEKLNKDN
jgi:archaellum component FlaC